MAQKAPGKHHRKGISLIEITRRFPDDAAAYRGLGVIGRARGVCDPAGLRLRFTARW